MRRLELHKTNVVNEKIDVVCDDRDPENGNASHVYYVDCDGSENGSTITFQHGPVKENGINGLTNEVLLAIVADRLDGFQSSRFACAENERARMHVLGALDALKSRTANRVARGVEGTQVV